MSDLREDPGCYQCGSFAGGTFRLCPNCIQRNEGKRNEIRSRRRRNSLHRRSWDLRGHAEKIIALAAILVISGAAIAAYYYITHALSA